MMKLFWLFGQKSNGERFLLREKVMGSPCPAILSRDVTDEADDVSTLARSILKVCGQIMDAIEVQFGPPPGFDSTKYRPLNKKEISEVKQIVSPVLS